MTTYPLLSGQTYIGTITEPCDCTCGHTEACFDCDGNDKSDITFDEWVCIEGTMFKLYDRREE